MKWSNPRDRGILVGLIVPVVVMGTAVIANFVLFYRHQISKEVHDSIRDGVNWLAVLYYGVFVAQVLRQGKKERAN